MNKLFREIKPGDEIHYINGAPPVIKSLIVKENKLLSPTQRKITYYFMKRELLDLVKEDVEKMKEIPTRDLIVESEKSFCVTLNGQPLLIATTPEELDKFVRNG